MEAGTFSKKWSGGLRGTGAYRAPEFDISRRIGGGKSMDIPAAVQTPLTETDRSLARSRELMERLRQMVTKQ